jgi:DNA-binding GntR family transcriptional regulator
MNRHQEYGQTDLASLAPIPDRRSLGQYVYETLKKAIVSGDLRPHVRVIESRVADSLGISRTPVREAIHKLEREGLVEKAKRGGFFVAGLAREDIEETFGIRSVLESYAAHLAALHHEKDELIPLEEKIKQYQVSLEKGQTEDLLQINTEFHDLLYDLSRSPKLIRMINDLRDQIYRFRRVLLGIQGMADESNRDHMLMLDCIRRRDAKGAEKIVKMHIMRGREIVLREFKKQMASKRLKGREGSWEEEG